MSPSSPKRSGDPLFGLVVGLYVALLVTPPTVFSVFRLVSEDSAVLYGTVIVTLTLVTGVGWWTTERTDGIAVRLGATRARWALAPVGLGYAFAGLSSFHLTVFGALAMFFGLGAMALGGAGSMMARTRYTDAVLADSERFCEFTAGWPERARRRLLLVALPLWLLGAVGFASVYLAPGVWQLTAVQALFPVGLVVFIRSEPSEYAVTAAGLKQRLPVARRLLPWERYMGYSRTADALVVHRSWWFDERFALADLDDPDAVETALARHLPRT